jgi:predicted transcriptional regulator
MMFLRDYREIIVDILEGAQVSQGVSKTRVKYEVQLSSTQTKEYLQYLQQCELLIFDKEKRVFRTTRKGKRFLKLYDEMSGLAPRRK